MGIEVLQMSIDKLNNARETASAICAEVDPRITCELSEDARGTVTAMLRMPSELWNSQCVIKLRDRLEACDPIQRVNIVLAERR
jgi:hypothetical protein